MFYEIASKRRSIRKFKDQEIEREKISSIIKTVLMAPSSRAIFPCRYIFVEDNDKIEKLSLSKIHGSAFLKNAPLALVICADKTKSDVWIEDASIATTYAMAACEELGLGNCWIQIRNRMHNEKVTSEEYVRKLLSIPGNISVLSILAIGYADESKTLFSDEEFLYKNVYCEEFGKIFI